MAEVTRILADQNISITAFIQKESRQEDNDDTDIILLTDRVREGDMNVALRQIGELDVINGEPTRIRVESLK